MSLLKPCIAAAAAMFVAVGANASTVFTEGFDNLASSGWVLTNNSSSPGNSWFQGNAGVFGAQAGPATNSYAAANYLSSGSDTGAIDNWLISPLIALGGATQLSFWLRSEDASGFLDTVKVYFNAGSSSATDDFSLELKSILAETSGWTQYTVALPDAVDGRIAFRYLMDSAFDANYVGVDSVQIDQNRVPEPASAALALLALGGMAVARRRRNTA